MQPLPSSSAQQHHSLTEYLSADAPATVRVLSSSGLGGSGRCGTPPADDKKSSTDSASVAAVVPQANHTPYRRRTSPDAAAVSPNPTRGTMAYSVSDILMTNGSVDEPFGTDSTPLRGVGAAAADDPMQTPLSRRLKPLGESLMVTNLHDAAQTAAVKMHSLQYPRESTSAGYGRNVDAHVYLNTKVMHNELTTPPPASTVAAGRGVANSASTTPLPNMHIVQSSGSPSPTAMDSNNVYSGDSTGDAFASFEGRAGRTESMPEARGVGQQQQQQYQNKKKKSLGSAVDPLSLSSSRVRRSHTTTTAAWRSTQAGTDVLGMSASITSSPAVVVSQVLKRPGCTSPHLLGSGDSLDIGRPVPENIDSIRQAIEAVKRSVAAAAEAPSLDGSTESLMPSPHRHHGVALFALFGMLERESKFEEFGHLYETYHTDLVPFLRKVSAVVYAGHPDTAKAHCQLIYLLEHPEARDRIGPEFYSDPVNSWPLSMLYLVCCFQVTARRCGYEPLLAAMQSGGLMAVGKGLFAALAVAMSANEEELVQNTARLYVAAFYVGVLMRRQQQELEVGLLKATHRSFALLLVNIPIFTLRLLVDEVNKGEDCAGLMPASPTNRSENGAFSASTGIRTPPQRTFPHSEVQVSRVISARSAIVCGHPLDLLRLDVLLTRYADFNGVKIHKDYLPSTAPENSSYYNRDMLYSLLEYWDYMGIKLDPSKLRARLYSPVDGEVWDAASGFSSTRFAVRVAEAATWRNQDLTYTLQHVRDGDVLLDFSANALPIGPLIAWTNKCITILAAPANRKHTSALPPPRRSPQDFVVLGTLHKLAIVNKILRAVRRELNRSKHSSAGSSADAVKNNNNSADAGERSVELGTSFEELGLLRSIHTAVCEGDCGGDAEEPQKHADAFRSPDDRRRDNNGSHASDGVGGLLSPASSGGSRAHRHGGNSSSDGISSYPAGTTHNSISGLHHAPTPLPFTSPHSNPRASGASVTSPLPAGVTVSLSHAAGRSSRSAIPQSASFDDMKSSEGSPAHFLCPLLYGTPPSEGLPLHPSFDREATAGGSQQRRAQPVGSRQEGSQPSSASLTIGGGGAEGGNMRPYFFNEEYVVHRNVHFTGVINVYQVSQLIKYYEMQFGCVLREGAVRFASLLREETGIEFPPYTLLLCPTVFALLELWDGYQFIAKWCPRRD